LKTFRSACSFNGVQTKTLNLSGKNQAVKFLPKRKSRDLAYKFGIGRTQATSLLKNKETILNL